MHPDAERAMKDRVARLKHQITALRDVNDWQARLLQAVDEERPGLLKRLVSELEFPLPTRPGTVPLPPPPSAIVEEASRG